RRSAPLPPQGPEREELKAGRRYVDEIVTPLAEKPGAAEKHPREGPPTRGAHAHPAHRRAQSFTGESYPGRLRKELAAVVIEIARCLQRRGGRQDIDRPAERRELPGKVSRAVHIRDHRRRI